MGAEKIIVILGFGRSGTTWISDIVSKSLGQIILFEPFHPCIYEDSLKTLYGSIEDSDNSEMALGHLRQVELKQIRNRWLLRNHLNSPIDKINQDFVDYIWDNSTIAGFKSIRLNNNIPWVFKNLTTRPVFIVRHPFAVISSIMNRPRYWDEFGWSVHWESFLKNISQDPLYGINYESILPLCISKSEKICFMWALTHIRCLKILYSLDVTPFFYEDFYQDPYSASRQLLDYLNIEKHIHPSYIFTPSLMTLKTAHEMYDHKELSLFPDYFWKDHFVQFEVDKMNELLFKLSLLDNDFSSLLQQRKYLT